MQTTIIILTIFNTLCILYFIANHYCRLYVTIERQKTQYKSTLLAYQIILWKRLRYSSSGIFTINIPRVFNAKKIILEEEIEHLMNDKHNKNHTLRAKFSWLKTWKDVCEFKRKYYVVDNELVDQLVLEFIENKNKQQ